MSDNQFGLQTCFLADVFAILGVNYKSVKCDVSLGNVFRIFFK